MRVSACRGCGEGIVWCTTGRGKKIPLDAEPSAAGDFVIEEADSNDPLARKLPRDAASTYTGDKFTCHFDTCPEPDSFRARRDSETP